MYPLVELTTGLLFVLAFYEFGLTLLTVKWLVFTCLIIVLVVTDFLVRILPDAVNWPGFAIGLVFSLFIPTYNSVSMSLFFALFGPHEIAPRAELFFGLADAFLGALIGSMLLWGAAAAYKLVRKQEGMGMGDVKMMAMVGAFLGPRGAFLTILLGTLLGSIIGVAWILLLYAIGWKRSVAVRGSRRGLGGVSAIRWAIASRYQLPLGTFLGIAALLLVYTDSLIADAIAAFERAIRP